MKLFGTDSDSRGRPILVTIFCAVALGGMASPLAAATAARLLVQTGHATYPSISVAPNGKFASSSDDRVVKVWTDGGRLLCEIPAPGQRTSTAWSQEGKSLLIRADLEVAVWNLERCGERQPVRLGSLVSSPPVAALQPVPATASLGPDAGLDGALLQVLSLASNRVLALTPRSVYTLAPFGASPAIERKRTPNVARLLGAPQLPPLREGASPQLRALRDQMEQQSQAQYDFSNAAILGASMDGSVVVLGPRVMTYGTRMALPGSGPTQNMFVLQGDEFRPLSDFVGGDRLAQAANRVALSPSGRWLAALTPESSGSRLTVVDLSTRAITANALLTSAPPLPAWLKMLPSVGALNPKDSYVAAQTVSGLKFSADEGQLVLLRGRVRSTADAGDAAIEVRQRADLSVTASIALVAAADANSGNAQIALESSADGRTLATVGHHVDGYRFAFVRGGSGVGLGASWVASELGIDDLAFDETGRLLVSRRQAGSGSVSAAEASSTLASGGASLASGAWRRVLSWSLAEGSPRELAREPYVMDDRLVAFAGGGKHLARIIDLSPGTSDRRAVAMLDTVTGSDRWRFELEEAGQMLAPDRVAASYDGGLVAVSAKRSVELEAPRVDAPDQFAELQALQDEHRRRLDQIRADRRGKDPQVGLQATLAEQQRYRDALATLTADRSTARRKQDAHRLMLLDGTTGALLASFPFDPRQAGGSSLRFQGRDRLLVGASLALQIKREGKRAAMIETAFGQTGVLGVAGASGRIVVNAAGATAAESSIQLQVPSSAWVVLGAKETMAAALVANDSIQLFDLGRAGSPRHTIRTGGGEVTALALSPDDSLLAVGNAQGEVTLFSTQSGALIARLFSQGNGSWAVVDGDSRFDTNNLDDNGSIHWVMADEPMKAYPLELLMRGYFEPRLLPRLLAGQAMRPVPPVADLNRAQPWVSIERIEPDPQQLGTVQVTVSLTATQDFRGRSSGATDLRLFRDGQMVAYALPQGQSGSALKAGERLTQVFKGVRLPTAEAALEFSAYAFNTDQVKSSTARANYAAKSRGPTKRRAYLVAIGVNSHDNPAWDLQFAANDARVTLETMSNRLMATRAFVDVVAVPLISDGDLVGGKATKDRIRAVLDVLAGRPGNSQLLVGLLGASQLAPATPDDLVVISFAGHGLADPLGEFYLLPQDTGSGSGRGLEGGLLSRALSTTELTRWLRDIDAGQFAMIIDACHSAAAVEGDGFKPGPMGSRGFGQLAYDKGMRVLAATQADDFALEIEKLKHGLLSHALVAEGLAAGRADWKPADKRIELAEWLGYARKRVPELHAEVKSGQVAPPTRGAKPVQVVGQGASRPLRKAEQEPALFDFIRKPKPLVIANLP